MNVFNKSLFSALLFSFAVFFAPKMDGMEQPHAAMEKPVLFIIMPGSADGGFDYLAEPEKKNPLWCVKRYFNPWYGGAPTKMYLNYDPFLHDENRVPSQVVIANLPFDQMDLGQQNCQAFYDQFVLKYINDTNYSGVVLGGASQGSTAAYFFLLNHKDSPEIIKRIKGVATEACLGSANFVINSVAPKFIRDNCYVLPPFIAEILGFLPWMLGFACYDACGSQLINIVKEIGQTKSLQDIPITIFHAKKDPIIPVKAAQAVVGGLVEGGHQKTYYMETLDIDIPEDGSEPKGKHVGLLTNQSTIRLFQTVLSPSMLEKYNAEEGWEGFTPEWNRIDKTLDHYHIFKDAYDDLIKEGEAFTKRSKFTLKSIRLGVRRSVFFTIIGLVILIPKLISPFFSYLTRKYWPRSV